ncbi:hypothetical protein PRZ48_014178 [Zasmidium cellare]|uniref:Uncharacterized protein n=1 Tax=Zasmidium cellare TaxID=395010 RepID=A0ABR0E099_ZASCE|nr:hypothetical protein PRZ48_014178 [Zasmidium cellare]
MATTASNTNSRLLGLPAELRNRIYEFVFADSEVYRNAVHLLRPHHVLLYAKHDGFLPALAFPPARPPSLEGPPRHGPTLLSREFEAAFAAEETQAELYWAQHALLTDGYPVPATMQAGVLDFSGSSRDVVWTATPFETFEKLYASFPSASISVFWQESFN